MNLHLRIIRKSLLQQLGEWWRRPPARDRILAALLNAGSELRGLHITQLARLGVFDSVYTILSHLEEQGLVESRPAPEIPTITGPGERPLVLRVYRLTEAGFKRAKKVPWQP